LSTFRLGTQTCEWQTSAQSLRAIRALALNLPKLDRIAIEAGGDFPSAALRA
jgi:hypothetical protein